MKGIVFEPDDVGNATKLESEMVDVLQYVEAVIFDHKAIFAGNEPKEHLTEDEKADLKILLRTTLKNYNRVTTDRLFAAAGVEAPPPVKRTSH